MMRNSAPPINNKVVIPRWPSGDPEILLCKEKLDSRLRGNDKHMRFVIQNRCLLLSIFFLMSLYLIPSPVHADSLTVALQIPIIGETKIPICQSHSEIGTDGKPHEVLVCTGIAQYITIVYQWATAFAAVLAVLAFTYAGVLWLIAGGDAGKVTESKKVMGNALIGLLLTLGSYMLLNLINPNLVAFKPIRVPGTAEIKLDLKEILTRIRPPTGTCCPPLVAASEVLTLMKKNGVNDSGGKSGGFEKNNTLMKPKLFAAVKMVFEQCPDAGLRISSTLRPADGGSWHQKGGAIDFAGKICGVEPEKLCDEDKSKALITSLMAAGYEVGTWTGTCGTYKDTGEGPHMHIELPGSPY